MAPSGEPGGEDLHKRALENHRKETVGFLILAKSILSDNAYKDLIKTSQEIVKRSSCTEDGTTAKKCEEILLEVFAGQTHVLKGFHHFLAGRDPFHDQDSQQSLEHALSFLAKVKESPCISDEDYNDLIATLTQFIVTKIVGVEDVYRKALLVFQWFLPNNDLEGQLISQSFVFVGNESHASVPRIHTNL